MIKTILSVCIMLVSTWTIQAQKSEIGRLQIELPKKKSRKDSIDVLNRLSILSHLRDRDSCIYYAEKALVLSRSIKYAKGTADALNGLGVCNISLNNYLAAQYFTDALEIYRELDDKMNESQILMNLSVLLFLDNNELQAKHYIYQAERISRELKNDSIRGIVLSNILALDKDLSTKRYSEIMDEGMCIASRYKDNRMIISYMNNRGTILYNKGHKLEGLSLLLDSERLADSVGCEYVRVSAVMTIGEMYLDMGSDKEGITYYEKGLQISDHYNYPDRSFVFLERLYQYYLSKKDSERALYYAKLLLEKQRKIHQETQRSGFNYVSYAEKEKQLVVLASEQKFQNLMMSVLIFIIFGLLTILYLLLKLYRKKKSLALAESEMKKSIESQKKELENRNYFQKMLITVLAHDVRQPFSNIIMSTNMLSEHPEMFSEQERSIILNELKVNAEQSIFFMDGILYWIKARKHGTELPLQSLSVLSLIDEASVLLEPLIRSRGLALTNRIPKSATVYGNRMILTFAIRNIIHNSIKFSPDGASIWLNINNTEENRITIIIKDEGRGMDEETKSQLFNPKIDEDTTDNTGAGVAMAISYELLLMTGCNIWVKSSSNSGSIFYIECPIEKND